MTIYDEYPVLNQNRTEMYMTMCLPSSLLLQVLTFLYIAISINSSASDTIPQRTQTALHGCIALIKCL